MLHGDFIVVAIVVFFFSMIQSIWYDSGNNVRGYPFDEIEGLVAHGYNELLEKLDESFLPEYQKNLNDQLLYLEIIDPFMDCRALTRFRSELRQVNEATQ